MGNVAGGIVMETTKPRESNVGYVCNNTDCKEQGIYHVWYVDCDSTPICGFNIAYHTLCAKCAADRVINGKNGYDVACVKRIGC